ncbi:hypothetical protein Tco_0518277 [Tanacetum coccineum]
MDLGCPKRKFVIVCYEKVVRIPLEGDEILRVHEEHTLGAAKALMNAKIDEPRISVITVVRDFTDVFPEGCLGLPHASTKLSFTEILVHLSDASHEVRSIIILSPSKCKNCLNNFKSWKTRVSYDLVIFRKEHRCRKLFRDAIVFEYYLAYLKADGQRNVDAYSMAEIRESSKIGPEFSKLENTDKVVLIKEKLKAARDRQKSYVDFRHKPLESEVGDHVLLKVSPWKDVVRFGKKEIKIDKTLRFVEEPIEIMDCKIQSLKHSRITLVKVRWNSKRGPNVTPPNWVAAE